jgi:hypothetical protein
MNATLFGQRAELLSVSLAVSRRRYVSAESDSTLDRARALRSCAGIHRLNGAKASDAQTGQRAAA